jgi:C-terminal processing protease CtpA/Prc
MTGKRFFLPLFMAAAVAAAQSNSRGDQPVVMAPVAVTAGPLGYLGITFDIDADVGFFSRVSDSTRIKSMVVSVVTKDSPSDLAGLMPRDQVLRIDGIPIKEYTIGALKGIREKEKGDKAVFVVTAPGSKAERTIDVIVGRKPTLK